MKRHIIDIKRINDRRENSLARCGVRRVFYEMVSRKHIDLATCVRCLGSELKDMFDEQEAHSKKIDALIKQIKENT